MAHHTQFVQEGIAISAIVEWILRAVLSVLFGVGVKILWTLAQSVRELNIRIAVIVDQIGWHKQELDKHDKRLERLERTKR